MDDNDLSSSSDDGVALNNVIKRFSAGESKDARVLLDYLDFPGKAFDYRSSPHAEGDDDADDVKPDDPLDEIADLPASTVESASEPEVEKPEESLDQRIARTRAELIATLGEIGLGEEQDSKGHRVFMTRAELLREITAKAMLALQLSAAEELVVGAESETDSSIETDAQKKRRIYEITEAISAISRATIWGREYADYVGEVEQFLDGRVTDEYLDIATHLLESGELEVLDLDGEYSGKKVRLSRLAEKPELLLEIIKREAVANDNYADFCDSSSTL